MRSAWRRRARAREKPVDGRGDAGSAQLDAAVPWADAALAPADSGVAVPDAASEPADAGSVAPDAAAGPADASIESQDARTPTPDAASGPSDASVGTDASAQVADGGPTSVPYSVPSAASRLTRLRSFLVEARDRHLADGKQRLALAVPDGGAYVRDGLLRPESFESGVVDRYDSYLELVDERLAELGGPTPLPGAGMQPPDDAPYFRPESEDPAAGDGASDATAAIQAALAKGNVWLAPGRTYVVTRTVTVPPQRKILSDGTAVVLLRTGPGGFDSVGVPGGSDKAADFGLRVDGASDVVLQDFRVHTPWVPPAVEPLLAAVDLRLADRVTLQGLELRGFPRARGIVHVNSCQDLVVRESLVHGSFTTTLTRQVTGIEVDEGRASVAGQVVNSQRALITQNFVLGVLVTKAIFEDTTYRAGKTLGLETDGINYASAGQETRSEISENVIADVGEGLDLFAAKNLVRDNRFERTFSFGMKVIHGASGNRYLRNRAVGAGLAGVVVAPGLNATPATRANLFVANQVFFPGSFDIAQSTLAHAIGGLVVESGNGIFPQANVLAVNRVSEPAFLGNPQWAAGEACLFAPGAPAGSQNALFANEVSSAEFGALARSNKGGCGAGELLASPAQPAAWTQAGVTVTSVLAADPFGQPAGTWRIAETATAGLHEVQQQVAVADGTLPYALSAVLKAETATRLMLRFPSLNRGVWFDLSGEGTVTSSDPDVTGAVVALPNGWHLLVVQTIPGAAVAKLDPTVRTVQPGTGDPSRAFLFREASLVQADVVGAYAP